MVSFLRHFRVSFRHSIKASFILIERDLFHYMAELSGRLVASQESNQAWHVECGCQRAFIFIFPVYFALSNISLFPTDFAVFCSVTCKGESSQHKQFPCNRKLLIYVFSKLSWQLALLFWLTEGRVIHFLIYSAYYSKKKHATHQEKSNGPVKMYICDFTMIVVQYDPVDFLFTRLSLL